MRAFKSMLSFLALLLLFAAAPTKDWKDVEAALGRAGTVQPDGAYKVSFPDAVVVHLDTDHSRRPVEVLESIPSIHDFVMDR